MRSWRQKAPLPRHKAPQRAPAHSQPLKRRARATPSAARSDVFESDYCVVADYGLFANGTISVRNRQRDKSVTGTYDGILGWAALNNRTGTHTADGSLSVYLQLPAPAPQGIPAPYDIIMLGPMSFGPFGAYEYAVVSDPFEISLFVLARDVKTYFQLYNATVFAQLEEWGFKHFINKPQMTIQDGCAEFSETDLDTCVSFERGWKAKRRARALTVEHPAFFHHPPPARRRPFRRTFTTTSRSAYAPRKSGACAKKRAL